MGNSDYLLPDNDLLRVPLDRIAMYYLLSSNEAHRQVLKGVGERLVQAMEAQLTAYTGAQPQQNHPDMLVARKWAGLLNYDLYRFEKADENGTTTVSIDYPADLVSALNESAAPSALNLQIFVALYKARDIRDGKTTGDALALWKQVHTILNHLKELDIKLEPYSRDDVIAGVAAALVAATAEGKCECPDEILQHAANALVEAAMSTVPATAYDDGYRERGTNWSVGSDRSAAATLPLLLLSPTLLQRTGLSLKKLDQALVKLARGITAEARKRLVQCLSPAWEAECNEAEHKAHDIGLKVLIELVRSAVLGEKAVNSRMAPVYLSGSLLQTLATDRRILYLTAASDALPGLQCAIQLKCHHGQSARALLDALIEHDLLAWPKHQARRRYAGEKDWRDSIDTYVAEQVLNGNTQLLMRYLEAFAPTPEALSGILYQLAAQAKTTEQGVQLFNVWPVILDRLLPAVRTERKGRYVYPGDIDDLDAALLPIPNEPLNRPPIAQLTPLGRWGRAFSASPQLLDRLIKALAAYGLALHPGIISFVLNVAGNDYQRISRHSTLVVPWMRLMLLGDVQIADSDRLKLTKFLDQMAKHDANALKLQHDLEV